ncbi:sugar phosphate isomerase/epimerase [Winogradskyella sp. 3972H.M.0a.05]|uniref:sugar phosphate isomerase/epimerase n=1 Tax=Winogradskyella sp. 3972H.M.0a.05 TaxID=2950277 RepID=UPI00339AF91C
MDLRYLYPFWGSEHLNASDFLALVKAKGFDGIEINVPKDSIFETNFYDALNKARSFNPNFTCVLQQVFGVKIETPEAYTLKVIRRLEDMVHYRPNFINSHTGKDHYSFDDNCRIIEAIENFSIQHNIPVYHEIHRGRFTFHSTTTLKYLEKFPELKLVGDFSHWCVVSESLLQDQQEAIQKIIPHVSHLHARVATEQASQVNSPFAPEWADHLERFANIWQNTISYHSDKEQFTITPEFGPFPYMPQMPFTQEPLANQEEVNTKMRDYLIARLK